MGLINAGNHGRSLIILITTISLIFSTISIYHYYYRGEISISLDTTERRIQKRESEFELGAKNAFESPAQLSNKLNDVDLENGDGSRKFPNAIIIGVKKGGTRALLEFLRLHPMIRAPGPEMHFFDRYYHLGLEWYRNRMPITTSDQLTIEKTPSYFIRREVPRRIYKMNPQTKILLVVRNPVTRAISDYTQSLTKGRTSKNFTTMAFLDPPDCRVVDISWSAIRIGLYYKHIQKWLRYFPSSQIHVVDGETLISRPFDEMIRVEQFLRLEPFIREEHFYLNSTKGFPCVKRRTDSKVYRCLGKTKGRTHPKVDEKILTRLHEFYAPMNRMFYNLTGSDFGWETEGLR